MKNITNQTLTLIEAARLLAVSARTIRRLIDKGDLRAVRIGATLAVPFDGMSIELQRCFDFDCPEPLLTLHDAAAELGCSPDEVRARTLAGELTSVHVGRSLRWSSFEVAQKPRPRGRT